MVDLSRLIDDLLSGRAKLHTSDPMTSAAATGASVNRWRFECPKNVMRLILHINLTTTKTTGTALVLRMYQAGVAISREIYLLNRTVGSDIIGLPSDDGSDKDEAEASSNTPLFMFPGDSIRIEHTGTVAETISDVMVVTYIEWKLEREWIIPERPSVKEIATLKPASAMQPSAMAMWR